MRGLDEIRLRRVWDYIAENLDQEITVAQLAGVARLSPSHFASMFRAATGVAPYRYVRQQRLESAKMIPIIAEMAAAPHNMKVLAEASPALLWGSLPDGVCDYHNPALCARYGISSEQAYGNGWSSTVHHDDVNALIEPWHASLKTGNPSKVLHRRRGYDGEYHRTTSAWNPVRDDFGRIIRWSGTNLEFKD